MADFTVAEFLDWARTKPADQGYNYCDPKNCAISQFGRETGRKHLVMLYSDQVKALPIYEAVIGHNWSFGALVKRLETIVQETPAKPSLWLNPQTYVDADCGERVS
jgi:hypothetical protein